MNDKPGLKAVASLAGAFVCFRGVDSDRASKRVPGSSSRGDRLYLGPREIRILGETAQRIIPLLPLIRSTLRIFSVTLIKIF